MCAACHFKSMLLSLLLTGSVNSREPVKAAGPDICGIGILAPSGKVLFLPSAPAGIDAVVLSNGKTLWKSKDTSTLLLATDEKVFGQAYIKGKQNQVKVIAVDAVTGERLLESGTIEFPDWVSVRPDYGLRFRSRAQLDKGDLVLAWEAHAFHDGGEPLPEFGPDGKPYVDPNAKKEGGAFRVNLATGKVTAIQGYSQKENEFGPGPQGQTKRQEWMFLVEESSPKPGFPHSLTRRILRAKTENGARSWQREVAGEVYLPPRP
jgi:hypothetical protein